MPDKFRSRAITDFPVYSPFDDMAAEYDSWFDKDGNLLFYIEVKAFKILLSSLPKPWLEIGVGSGRFAQALGIEAGIDPSLELIRMARNRGIKAVQGRGEDKLYDQGTVGTAVSYTHLRAHET